MTDSVTIDLLREYLKYDEDTGKLFWKERNPLRFSDPKRSASWNARYAGREAFTARSGPYFVGRIGGVKYYAHRVVYAMLHGEWPDVTDHKDGDGTNNRPDNLRSGTQEDNTKGMHAKVQVGTSRYRGVFRGTHAWIAQFSVRSKTVHVGSFDTERDAALAWDDAAVKNGYKLEATNGHKFPELRSING